MLLENLRGWGRSLCEAKHGIRNTYIAEKGYLRSNIFVVLFRVDEVLEWNSWWFFFLPDSTLLLPTILFRTIWTLAERFHRNHIASSYGELFRILWPYQPFPLGSLFDTLVLSDSDEPNRNRANEFTYELDRSFCAQCWSYIFHRIAIGWLRMVGWLDG